MFFAYCVLQVGEEFVRGMFWMLLACDIIFFSWRGLTFGVMMWQEFIWDRSRDLLSLNDIHGGLEDGW